MPPKGSKRKKRTDEPVEGNLEDEHLHPVKVGKKAGVKLEESSEPIEKGDLGNSNIEGTVEAKTETEVKVKTDLDEGLPLREESNENALNGNDVPFMVRFLIALIFIYAKMNLDTNSLTR